jgi:hypothetical protein
MLLLLNKVTCAMNNKKHSLVIFCDLKKAFDTCNHSILKKNFTNLAYRVQNSYGLKTTCLIVNSMYL